jgi:hypothetical protein
VDLAEVLVVVPAGRAEILVVHHGVAHDVHADAAALVQGKKLNIFDTIIDIGETEICMN